MLVRSGQFDSDLDPSTPCTATGQACTQQCPPGSVDDDCDAETQCLVCQAGSFAAGGNHTFVAGGVTCPPCTASTIDHDSDPSTPCVPCKRDGSHACQQAAMTHALAAPGYYIAGESFAEANAVAICQPSDACVGGVGQASCAAGYKVRCRHFASE